MSNFSKDKALHSLEVANFMRNRASKLGLDEDTAWIVGYVHDIGYVHGYKDHNKEGCEMMHKLSSFLAPYILYHDLDELPNNHLEFLLRLADLVVDETGKYVGIEARIKSIVRRNINVNKEKLYKTANNLKQYARDNDIWFIMEDCL